MIDGLNPALILILGGLLVPLVPSLLRRPYMLALPLLALLQLWWLPHGDHGQIEVLGYSLVTLRVDKLSLLFGIIFQIAALLGVIYALHIRDTLQHIAALVYAGAASGALFAGDLITLFVYWEMTAITSVFLIWARRTERAYRVGLRYLIIQVTSGVILLAGVILHYRATGSLAFAHLGLGSPAGVLIFIAFGIKCAFPFLHNWLQDAYPEATVTGTVVLSAFTTKLAVYALARGYAGESILITIGAAMTAFPIFYAVIENDLRRVLAYSLNNQLGFMVAGIGIGTELALNGTAAHAFAHILYKALLFMSMGAVLYRTGTIKASELGGLYKSMPWTATFCIIGSASISAFPLLSGFVTKSMILAAAAEQHHWFAFLVLLFASAGVLDHSGIKIPYFSFFAHDSGIRVKEAPLNMLLAMGATAALCIGIGIYPQPLYDLLPYAVEFVPYTFTHVVTQLQLLLFSMLAFVVLVRIGRYPPELPSVNLDFDWLYRAALPGLTARITEAVSAVRTSVTTSSREVLGGIVRSSRKLHDPRSTLARSWASSSAALVILIVFICVLLLNYSR